MLGRNAQGPHQTLTSETDAPLMDILSGQPAFSIQSRHAAGSGCGDGLAEIVISHIAGSEHTFNARIGALWSRPDDVTLRGRLQLAIQEVCVRSMTDRTEIARGWKVFRFR